MTSEDANSPKDPAGPGRSDADARREPDFIDPVTGKPVAPGSSEAGGQEPAGWLPPAPTPGASVMAGQGGQGTYGGWLPPAPGPGIPVTPPRQHAVETREYAGWWSRVGAHVLDSLIVSIPIVLLALAVYFVFIGDSITWNDDLEPVGESLDAGQIVAIVVAGIAALIYGLGYAPFWMARTNGQTIGKQVAKIRVVRIDGRPISFWFAAAREIGLKSFAVGAAAQLTFGVASLLNYLWPLWDAENRAVHDLIIKTRVVKAG